MILILSQEARESSTEYVLDWLEHYDAPYRRINGEDIDGKRGLTISCTDESFDLVGRLVGPDPEDVRAVWYRRWQHNRDYLSSELFREGTPEKRPGGLMTIIGIQLNKEIDRISEVFFDLYGDAEWLSTPSTEAPNKLRILRTARRHGFAIPDSIIADTRDAVASFASSYEGIVTKPVSDACFLPLADGVHITYTTALDDEDVDGLPDRFFPSLFQEQLEKRYEIRVFVLGGTCYSMAIFSQADEQTTVDFRRYNYAKSNRCVPYALPSEVRERLLALMSDLGYETGSVDLIRTVDGAYVFLEINPIGQFGMVSQPCNYKLEREIARHLIAVHDRTAPDWSPASHRNGV